MAVLRGNAEAAIGMAVHVAGLLRTANDRLFDTSTSTVNGRILATLLSQVEARQARHPEEEQVELVGSTADLARLSGTQKDDAARVLHWLENEDVISIKRGRIVVHSTGGAAGAPRLSPRRTAALALPGCWRSPRRRRLPRRSRARRCRLDPSTAGPGDDAARRDRRRGADVRRPRAELDDDRAPARHADRHARARSGCAAARRPRAGAARPRARSASVASSQSVTGYLAPGGETELAWTITVYLGDARARAADVTSLVLRAELLGADRVDQLLTPALGRGGRRTARSSAAASCARRSRLEARFAQLPGALHVAGAGDRDADAIRAGDRRGPARARGLRPPRPGPDASAATGPRRSRTTGSSGTTCCATRERCGGTWPAELRLGFPSGVAPHRGPDLVRRRFGVIESIEMTPTVTDVPARERFEIAIDGRDGGLCAVPPHARGDRLRPHGDRARATRARASARSS